MHREKLNGNIKVVNGLYEKNLTLISTSFSQAIVCLEKYVGTYSIIGELIDD